MLRDDRAEGERRRATARNVLGEPLDICSIQPMTGFFRDGCCNTSPEDIGSHTVCTPKSSGPVLQQPSRKNPVSGLLQHSCNRSPKTLRDGAWPRLGS